MTKEQILEMADDLEKIANMPDETNMLHPIEILSGLYKKASDNIDNVLIEGIVSGTINAARGVINGQL